MEYFSGLCGFFLPGGSFNEIDMISISKIGIQVIEAKGRQGKLSGNWMDETVGNDTNSICYELHWKAVDILEGRKHDPAFYPVIYGVADDGEWTDPAVWKKANPSIGITIGIDKVEAACEQAKQNPAEENAFRQLRLNQWVKQDVRWMPMKK